MQSHNSKIGSNKSFGLWFFLIFLLIGIYPLIDNAEIRVWALIVSFLFFGLGISNSKILSSLNRSWFKFGIILSKIMSPLIMGLIFFCIVMPIGIIMRLLNYDLLRLRLNDKITYWVKKDEIKNNMKKQY